MAADSLTGGRYAEPSVLILTSLAGGPKHGYALIQDIREFAGMELGAGTLYGALARLEREQLIRPLDATPRRRPYEMTSEGRQALQDHLAVVARIARTGQHRLSAAATA
jgi:DNA-binding PadR family transcriptional regulator